jgi:hypothetical protein
MKRLTHLSRFLVVAGMVLAAPTTRSPSRHVLLPFNPAPTRR